MTGGRGGPVASFDPITLGSEIQRRIGVKTSRDEPLARFTTMRVGGPADLFAVAHNAFELRALAKFARTRGIPHVILGRGSDVVIADAGIRGLVIQVRAEGIAIHGDRLEAEAGVAMARAATVGQVGGLTGLEFGLAIPGTVGGAIWANAGAHDSDVAAVLDQALVLRADGSEVRLDAAGLGLGYRQSSLKGVRPPEAGPADHGGDEAAGPTDHDDADTAAAARSAALPPRPSAPAAVPDVVLGATFRLYPAAPEEIGSRLEEIRRWRRAHQPIGIPSAGSYFRNPPGDSAGRLIDAAGLKGYREGGASVSEKHANFIINDRHGTAADVRSLGDHLRDEVARRFGIVLEDEVVFLGDWGPAWPPERRL